MRHIIITVCVKAISILSASFLCQPYMKFKEFFHLLVSSLIVLSDVIVEDNVGLCTCIIIRMYIQKGNGVLFNCFLLWYVRTVLFTNKLVQCANDLSELHKHPLFFDVV